MIAVLQATFKSDYMALVTAAGTAMTELLCTKQTLSEAWAAAVSAFMHWLRVVQPCSDEGVEL